MLDQNTALSKFFEVFEHILSIEAIQNRHYLQWLKIDELCSYRYLSFRLKALLYPWFPLVLSLMRRGIALYRNFFSFIYCFLQEKGAFDLDIELRGLVDVNASSCSMFGELNLIFSCLGGSNLVREGFSVSVANPDSANLPQS